MIKQNLSVTLLALCMSATIWGQADEKKCILFLRLIWILSGIGQPGPLLKNIFRIR